MEDWVESIGYSEYRGAFREAQVDGARLLGLTTEALKEEILIASAEHVLVIEVSACACLACFRSDRIRSLRRWSYASSCFAADCYLSLNRSSIGGSIRRWRVGA